MTRYCLVTGTQAPANQTQTVHRLDCPAYDLATLLSEGRIVNIGKFEHPLLALLSIKCVHPAATVCPHCCVPVPELIPAPSLLRWAAGEPANLLLSNSA